MKNNFFILILISIFCLAKPGLTDSFTFKSKNIEILDKGNQINAFNSEATSIDKKFYIKSDKFIYLKNLDTLESSGNGVVLINSKNLTMKYDSAIFDQKNLNIKAYGNIEIFHNDRNFTIQTSEIFYDQKNNIIRSNKTTKIKDNENNTHLIDNFIYEVNKNLLKVENLITEDSMLNIYKTSIAFINTKSGKIFGKDIKVNLKDSPNQKESSYRFKGNSIKISNNTSKISKGVFTTCKEREGCPPWQFSAKNITHDKKKREISYDKALLKIYDIPIAYFPKFFHPDPTVKRKSGFLIPSIKNSSNSNNFLNIPYFHVVAENKDFTFSPRLYASEKFLLQTEYRQKEIRSDHLLDFSFFAEKDKNTKSHFFYNLDKDLIFKKFDKSELNLKLQTVSNDIYLKSEKIESEILGDKNVLENSFGLDLYSNNLSVNLSSKVYENLNKDKSDRYEYILPRILLIKNFDENFSVESDTLVRNYDTNIFEKQNINNFIYNSNNTINKFGFTNNHQYLIRNTNSRNKNSNYKNKKNFYLSSIYQFNSTLPLIKESDSYRSILKPRLSLRAAPNHTKDQRNTEKKVDVTNIYSLDRVTDQSSIEGGFSAAYGFNYSLQNKLNTTEILKFKVANNLRLKKNEDLSRINQMGDKVSNIFTETSLQPHPMLNLKYSSSIKNNLKDINYENLVSKFEINNFVTTFDYLNENNTQIKNSYLSNITSYSLDNFNKINFSTRKNKAKDLTEYYKFMYQYKNDCLAASVEYSKDFYTDRDLKPDESFLFKLTITPFAEVMAPNIK